MTLVFKSNKTTSKCTTLKICVKTAIIIKEICTGKHNGINPFRPRTSGGSGKRERLL